MAAQIHLNGEAKIRTGTGAASALEDLAVSVNGVTMTFRPKFEDVILDTFGPLTAFDFQMFLADATIEIDAVWWDETVYEHNYTRTMGGATFGQMPAAGTLMGASGSLFRVLILSPTDGLPYNFPACKLNDWTMPVGTRRTIPRMTFHAIPYTGAIGSASGAVLFNRVTT